MTKLSMRFATEVEHRTFAELRSLISVLVLTPCGWVLILGGWLMSHRETSSQIREMAGPNRVGMHLRPTRDAGEAIGTAFATLRCGFLEAGPSVWVVP